MTTQGSKSFGYRDLFDNAEDYFRLNGSGKMVLTKTAAMTVCDMLTERGIFVNGVDAGYWRNPGYEERPEYGYFRWPRYYHLSVEENNELAKETIQDECSDLDVFLISELRQTC